MRTTFLALALVPFLALCAREIEVEEEPVLPAAVQTVAPTVVPPVATVAAGEQLAVTAADVQLGADGKYFIADRGDGCRYVETSRQAAGVVKGVELPEVVLLWAEGCPEGISYYPATGRVNVVTP